MSSKLSAVAQLQILRFLAECDDLDSGQLRFSDAPSRGRLLADWYVLDDLYLGCLAAPPESYLRSRELAMIQRDAVSEEDLRFIFSHGQPLVFEACPNHLVPKVIKAFQELREEPSFLLLDIECGSVGRIEVSPPLYVDRFPCTACRRDATIQARFRPDRAALCGNTNVECVVEKFHICSKHFTKQLSLELYYSHVRTSALNDYAPYVAPEPRGENAKSWSPIKAIVRAEDPVCGVAAVSSSKVASKRTAMMLVPEFAVEVYGFLDRRHVGASLLANGRMHDCLSKAKSILPVHQLSCEVKREELGRDDEPGGCRMYYRLLLRHFQRDLPYNDARQFKLCEVMSPQEECALALRYLDNSYIVQLRDSRCAGSRHAKFFLHMIGALVERNVSVGHMGLGWFGALVRDYRTLERVFNGQLPVTTLCLSLDEPMFVGFAKITDFFRYPAVQRLKELHLSLHDPWNKPPPRTRMGPTPNPLWIDGIHHLRNCDKYEVHHSSKRIRSTVRKRLVQICEKFGRDEISETVKHFVFRPYIDSTTVFPFSSDDLVASRVNLTAEHLWAYVGRYEWDVYHFRNVVASKALTALVGHGLDNVTGGVLHLLRGAVYPDALLTFRES